MMVIKELGCSFCGSGNLKNNSSSTNNIVLVTDKIYAASLANSRAPKRKHTYKSASGVHIKQFEL